VQNANPGSSHRIWRIAAIMGALVLACVVPMAPVYAQSEEPPPPPPGAPPSGQPPPGRTLYVPAQLDQMVAPIALYPDDLLGQILMAATYPLEVVQADRWLQDSQNASLQGSSLAQALQAQPWDPSVKSLVPYPQLLSMMDSNLDWTEALGDAFLAQQSDVMDSVQRLRKRAQAAGTLSSNSQETVTDSDQAVEIASPNPTVEYVPVYNPQVAYGDWPYPDYPPEYFYVPGYDAGAFIAYPVLAPYWGWDRWDWRHHHIDIDNGGAGRPPGEGRGRQQPVPWHHDPSHRGGVPYRDPATRTRFEGPNDIHSAQSNFRGYPARSEPAQPERVAQRAAPPPPVAQPRVGVVERPAPRPEAPRFEAPHFEAPREMRPPAAIQRPSPPAMESFGRGEVVHAQEQRGSTSRMSVPAGGERVGGHR
jgi:hypothetical protein